MVLDMAETNSSRKATPERQEALRKAEEEEAMLLQHMERVYSPHSLRRLRQIRQGLEALRAEVAATDPDGSPS